MWLAVVPSRRLAGRCGGGDESAAGEAVDAGRRGAEGVDHADRAGVGRVA